MITELYRSNLINNIRIYVKLILLNMIIRDSCLTIHALIIEK